MLNGIKQFIEWIGYQTFNNMRNHSQKFILLNVCYMFFVHCLLYINCFEIYTIQTPPRWQLIKTAKLLKLCRDKLTLSCKISKQRNNEENCKQWINEFEYLCDNNKILELMIDECIIYETHPYNKMFHCINNIECKYDIEQDNNEIEMNQHKAMSIKTIISFIGIFINGKIVLNKLLLKYKQYNEIALSSDDQILAIYSGRDGENSIYSW